MTFDDLIDLFALALVTAGVYLKYGLAEALLAAGCLFLGLRLLFEMLEGRK